MDFANIELNWETLEKAYPHPTRDPNNPVKQYFANWQKEVKARNEARIQEAEQNGTKPVLEAVPTSCCYQVSHALNETADKIPALSYRRPNDRINARPDKGINSSGNGYYLMAVDEMEKYLVSKYGLTSDISVVGDFNARIKFLKELKTKGLITMTGKPNAWHTEFWNGDKILQNEINNGTMSVSGVFSNPRMLFWTIKDNPGNKYDIPSWLAGWWSVNDGEQYYYHFDKRHGCYWTKVNPGGKFSWPTINDLKNTAEVEVSQSPPHLTLRWANWGTIEWFTKVPGNDSAMMGLSNKYPPLVATKI